MNAASPAGGAARRRLTWTACAALAALAVGGWTLARGLDAGGADTAAHNRGANITAPSTPPSPPPSGPSSASPPASAAATAPPAPLGRSLPVRVRIPAAGIDTAPVLRLGLAPDGTLQVPSVAQADRIGWYDGGVTPGERGPAVLVGHFDTVEGPAVLAGVAKIHPGATITVTRADGTSAVFTVRALQQVSKTRFPTARVYGDTAGAELRVITCGGPLVSGHHPDNIIIYATLTSTT
ncbi:class F sortase [Streptomyces sp. NPDC021224]|uniref:class F sortase n=1 Tax=unclassified Streptomyces TaxID=2593676 RepID=UPI0037A303F0